MVFITFYKMQVKIRSLMGFLVGEQPTSVLVAIYITLYDNSRQTISTTIAVFRKYVLTTRVFDHQDWSNIYNCWLSRLSCAARARTLFRKGEYVKSDAAPMRRLS